MNQIRFLKPEIFPLAPLVQGRAVQACWQLLPGSSLLKWKSEFSFSGGGSGFSLTISTSETKWVILRAKINLTSESGHQKLAICCKANTELWSPALSFSTAQSPYHSHLNHSDFPPKCTLHWSSPAKDSGLLSSILRTLLEKIQFGTSKETFDLSLSQMIASYSPWATAALGAFQREMI